MSRVETIGDATLYLGDCREILPTLPVLIDAVVTDPPYNVGFRYASHNDAMGGAEYLAWLRSAFQAAADAGAWQIAWFWQGIRVANGQARHCLPEGYAIHHCAAWYKREFAGDLWRGNHPAFSWEPIVWAARLGMARYAGPKGGHDGRDCLVGNQSRHDGKFDHPCYKTLSVVRGVVGWLAGEAIADPFMGSGTTGVAAIQHRRKFIGIEIEPRYFDIACERIDNAYRQQRMFA